MMLCGVLLGAVACADGSAPAPATLQATSGSSSQSVEAPADCLPSAEAERRTIKGTPEWMRFCPGPGGHTAPAEVPSDALTTHLDHLAQLTETAADVSQEEAGCSGAFSRTLRVQVGYAGDEVTEIVGLTDPGCLGTITGSGERVRDPEGLGVYGALMAAFGQQYADSFEAAPSATPLICPVDPRKPDSVDIDGSSASLDTGWHLGERAPMVMPLAAVGGIVCTWTGSERQPTMRRLAAEEAELVRIGLHAIVNATVDCGGSPDPTYTAVVEDKTGTRRAVTVIDSECSTVIGSDGGFGLGFPWLQR